MRRLPNFLIIGAPKSGTNALYHWLAGNPQVHLSTPKEPYFFEEEYDRGPEYYWQRYFAAGWRGQSLVGEARTAHLYLPYVTRRIYETVPDARLVAILRNPVERAFSHWWMLRCHGREPLGFDEALRANRRSLRDGTSLEGPGVERRWRANILARNDFWRPKPLSVRPYIEPGHYARHLERFLVYFPRSQLCVLLYDDLVQRPQDTTARLLEFLGLDASGMRHAPAPENVSLTRFSRPLFQYSRRFRLERFVPHGLLAAARTSLSKIGSRPVMSDAAREWLQNYFEPHNRHLEPLLGRDLSAWDN